MKSSVDLNCDMAESFGQWSISDAPDHSIMQIISSANVAAGFHAGDPNLINQVVQQAREFGVGLGVHPGYHDLQGFGRRFIDTKTSELINDIIYQLGAVREFGRRYGVPMQHIKLHGALYMEAAKNRELSDEYLAVINQISPDLLVFCMDISETYAAAKAIGQPVIREFFADRDYDNSGSIVFKRKVSKPSPEELAEKCVRACKEGVVRTVEGDDIEIEFDSICFHSDTPGALDIGQAIKKALTENQIKITPAAMLV